MTTRQDTKALNLASVAIIDLLDKIAELEKAIRYASDYLDDNKLNSIGSGSKAHMELKEALKEQVK